MVYVIRGPPNDEMIEWQAALAAFSVCIYMILSVLHTVHLCILHITNDVNASHGSCLWLYVYAARKFLRHVFFPLRFCLFVFDAGYWLCMCYVHMFSHAGADRDCKSHFDECETHSVRFWCAAWCDMHTISLCGLVESESACWRQYTTPNTQWTDGFLLVDGFPCCQFCRDIRKRCIVFLPVVFVVVVCNHSHSSLTMNAVDWAACRCNIFQFIPIFFMDIIFLCCVLIGFESKWMYNRVERYQSFVVANIYMHFPPTPSTNEIFNGTCNIYTRIFVNKMVDSICFFYIYIYRNRLTVPYWRWLDHVWMMLVYYARCLRDAVAAADAVADANQLNAIVL